MFLLDLLTRRDPDTLERINRVLGKMHKPRLDSLPDLSPTSATAVNRVSELLTPAFRRQTALVWAAFFLTLSSLYFAQTWTPKIIVDAGFNLTEGVSIGVLIQVGALLGILAIGLLTAWLSVTTTAALLMGFGFVAMVAFSLNLGQIGALSTLAVCIGLGVNAAVIALYALVADTYPADIRTTAVGWAIGIGRLSAVLSPVIAGFLLDFGTQEATLYLMFALPMLVAAGLVLAVRPKGA